ncbi:MAG: hypothetical protein ACLQMS_20195 [Desulfomonilaceae bacterium]
MKAYSEVEVLVLRGFLCKLDYPNLQYIGQFGTDEDVIDMSRRVVMSAQSLFDVKPALDREINC